MNINKCLFVGRLADDVKYFEAKGNISARAVGRLIINRPPSKDGQRRYDVIPFVAWGAYADNLARFTAKGKELGIEGSLHLNAQQNADTGEWKTYVEVQVKDVQFGRDSQTLKVMKAAMEEPATVASATVAPEATAQPDDDMQSYIDRMMKDPRGRKRIALAAGLEAPKATEAPKVVEEEAPNPFLEP